MLSGLLNGVFAAGLALIGLFAIGNLLGITTSIQLQELSRPTPPLLRQLLLKAPGTYHHSLMVSNLAEQAAERIGADSMLVRVMAYYHDIGKMQRPYFFIENQPVGMANVHERLDPQISARIIISHVLDGMDLAEKYRLPQTLKDGIAQHHGTGLVRFFYYQALEAAKKNGSTIEEANFCYPGPKPQTKETGVLMLADVSETTVRALKPGSAAEIDEIVRKASTHHLDTGQLDECDLTIADLHQIRTAFVDILQGIHHPRIKYPEQLNEEASAQAQLPPPNPAADSTQMTPPARSAVNGQPLPP
jgi:putative nucleotidyltransferase with HDIG domain